MKKNIIKKSQITVTGFKTLRHEKIFLNNFKVVIKKLGTASLTGNIGLLPALIKIYFYAEKYLSLSASAKTESKRKRALQFANYYAAILFSVGLFLNLVELILR